MGREKGGEGGRGERKERAGRGRATEGEGGWKGGGERGGREQSPLDREGDKSACRSQHVEIGISDRHNATPSLYCIFPSSP